MPEIQFTNQREFVWFCLISVKPANCIPKKTLYVSSVTQCLACRVFVFFFFTCLGIPCSIKRFNWCFWTLHYLPYDFTVLCEKLHTLREKTGERNKTLKKGGLRSSSSWSCVWFCDCCCCYIPFSSVILNINLLLHYNRFI